MSEWRKYYNKSENPHRKLCCIYLSIDVFCSFTVHFLFNAPMPWCNDLCVALLINYNIIYTCIYVYTAYIYIYRERERERERRKKGRVTYVSICLNSNILEHTFYIFSALFSSINLYYITKPKKWNSLTCSIFTLSIFIVSICIFLFAFWNVMYLDFVTFSDNLLIFSHLFVLRMSSFIKDSKYILIEHVYWYKGCCHIRLFLKENITREVNYLYINYNKFK